MIQPLALNLSVFEGSFPIKAAIRVFPNLSAGTVTVAVNDNALSSSGESRVYDSFGREIRNITGITSKEILVTREGLESGIYFICLIQDNVTIASQRLIICD